MTHISGFGTGSSDMLMTAIRDGSVWLFSSHQAKHLDLHMLKLPSYRNTKAPRNN